VNSTNTLASRTSAAPPTGGTSPHVRGPAQPGRPAPRRTSARRPAEQAREHRPPADSPKRAFERAQEASRTKKICEQIGAELTRCDGGGGLPSRDRYIYTEPRLEAAFEQLVTYADPVTGEELTALCAGCGPDAEATAEALKTLDVLVASGPDSRWLPRPVTMLAWRVLAGW
jgi:hypothetical protein